MMLTGLQFYILGASMAGRWRILDSRRLGHRSRLTALQKITKQPVTERQNWSVPLQRMESPSTATKSIYGLWAASYTKFPEDDRHFMAKSTLWNIPNAPNSKNFSRCAR